MKKAYILDWLRGPFGISVILLGTLSFWIIALSGIPLFVNSVIIGLIWALVAAGLTLVFGIMNVPNFAQGAFFMVGTLAAFLLHKAFDLASLHGVTGFVAPFVIVIASALISALLGAFVERTILYALRKRSGENWVTDTFVLTFAIAILLVNLHQVLFGANTKGIVGYYIGVDPFAFGQVRISADRAFAAFIGVTALLSLWLLLRHTRIGREMRAVSQDEAGARMIGISVEKIYCVTFALSCGLAGLAGATLLFLFPSSPYAGDSPLYIAWTIVVLAGLGNVAGTIVAGIAIALISNITAYLWGITWIGVVPFVLMVALLLIRPSGLFGQAIKGVWER